MKLASFSLGGTISYGIVSGDGIIDVGARSSAANLVQALADPAGLAQCSNHAPDHALDQVVLLPPIPAPGRIICVGLNYKSHIAETGRDLPHYPMLFPRYADTLVGHNQSLIRPRVSEQFDFEGELAFVIGRAGRHIRAEDAMAHVAGYACLNDGSLRDYQRHTSQFLPGKCFDQSGSFGPWIVTPDEVGELGAQTIETRLNGQMMQRATLDDLLFGVADLIAYMSTMWTVQPGDVVATGTPGGVGLFRSPPVWMVPGDVVEVEISRIGVLTNTIAGEA